MLAVALGRIPFSWRGNEQDTRELGETCFSTRIPEGVDELVPSELPAWQKDLRPPTARAGD